MEMEIKPERKQTLTINQMGKDIKLLFYQQQRVVLPNC